MRELIVVLVMLAAMPAWADSSPEAAVASDNDRDIADLPFNRFGVGVFAQDVLALTPGTGGFIAPVRGSVIGVAGTYQRRLSLDSGWFLDLGGAYGVGHETVQVFQPFAFQNVTSFTLTLGHGGFGYEVRLSRRATAHAGAGLFYSRARATFDNGASRTRGEHFDAFGLEASMGLRLDLHGAFGLHAEQVAAYGWGSGRGPDAKYSASFQPNGFRGGLIAGF